MRHTSRDFDAEMTELRGALVAMGDRCRRAIVAALEVFAGGSEARFAEVADLDRQIDEDEMAIDALVIQMLALRQPVASDLRLLAMALKLVADLERIGDEALNIAERAGGGQCPVDRETHVALDRMASESQEMLATALDAFVTGDEASAEAVLMRDDAVDALYSRTLADVQDYMQRHPEDAAVALRVISVAKYLERIADHATNIAEEVIFIVRGDDVRHHESLARLAAAARTPR
jgi:phosphate transport system protein